jgi:signal transduction histidine kinase
MNSAPTGLTPRERELGAIILQYNEVTERLKRSHDQLLAEVGRLREELERKNRELERRERLAALGHMAAGLAHEIRNPLGSIQLYASLLARDLTDRPKQFQTVEKISRAVHLLDGLVSDVLAFGKPTEPQRRTVVLGRVIDQVVSLVRHRLERAGVTLSADDCCRDVELWADDRQLQQILLNVLVNGIEAARPDAVGQAWVRLSTGLSQAGEEIVVSVADSGAGVEPEILQRIFNPFFTTKDSGTGLGLAIVHQLVEAHGGRISAGRHEGGGAVFTIRLPVGQVEPVTAK